MPPQQRPEWSQLHADLAALHAAAMEAADPSSAVTRALALSDQGVTIAGRPVPLAPRGTVRLVAAGKAALGMAAAACAVLGDRIVDGVVVHPHGARPDSDTLSRLPGRVIRCAASHPLPDDSSLAAGAAVEQLLARSDDDDLVLVLLSGGASSLLESLPRGLTLADLRCATQALQHAGADIVALNTVRRALSRLKGGGLARLAAPARVATLALSDVVGDRPETIGSGPTVASPTGADDALRVLERHDLSHRMPELVALLRATAARAPESGSAPAIFHIVGSNRQAVEAVARVAGERGFHSQAMTTILEGEARDAGRTIAGFALSVAERGVPCGPPACLVFGGETTVTVRGRGRGGRSQELALGAALMIRGCAHTAVLSFATDGVDGSSDAAGALVTGETVARAEALGLSPQRVLADNDSGPFFRALGDSWGAGLTGTNVNDLAVVLVYP